MADVHYMREAAMRLVARLTICFVPILAIAAQTDAQAPSDPQAYCVNHSADFYPYTGEPCKSGYQLGSGNCRKKTDGRMVAVPREQCVARLPGTVELPVEVLGSPVPPKADMHVESRIHPRQPRYQSFQKPLNRSGASAV